MVNEAASVTNCRESDRDCVWGHVLDNCLRLASCMSVSSICEKRKDKIMKRELGSIRPRHTTVG
jgi:hypothetical protein